MSRRKPLWAIYLTLFALLIAAQFVLAVAAGLEVPLAPSGEPIWTYSLPGLAGDVDAIDLAVLALALPLWQVLLWRGGHGSVIDRFRPTETKG